MYAVNDGLGQGGLPQINLASVGSLYLPDASGVLTLHLKSCNGSPFHGTKLLNCAARPVRVARARHEAHEAKRERMPGSDAGARGTK